MKKRYDVFKYLVNHFATIYVQSKIMGMDKVFVHMVYKYILSDKLDWIDETQLVKIKQAANISKVKYQNITNQSYEFTINNFDKKKMINKTISFYRSI